MTFVQNGFVVLISLLITILWEIAFADSVLEVDEERLIRRISDLIHIKNIDVLKIKDKVKKSKNPNN